MNNLIKRLLRKDMKRVAKGKQPMHLDHILLKFSDKKQDSWTLRDAYNGVGVFGGIGSGKTSGSGSAIRKAYLKNQMGGIVCIAKPGETDLWIKDAKALGRSDDLIIFNPESRLKFNPLDYELKRVGRGSGATYNIVQLFLAIMKMGNRVDDGKSGGGGDIFWTLAMERLITAAIDILKLANEEITVNNIARVISEIPIDMFRKADFLELIHSGSDEDQETLKYWCSKSYTVYCLAMAFDFQMEDKHKMTFDLSLNYLLSEFPNLAPNTRTSVTEQFYAFANPFRSGILAETFAQNTSPELLPEVTFEGKIVLLDFPIKQYLTVGIYAQTIYKRIWQQAVEARDLNIHPHPVFMWIDEAHYFVNSDDVFFQTTAREQRACTVLISQSISNYYATLGSENIKAKVDSLMGNLSTKIFHCNQDNITNVWSADTIGKTQTPKASFTSGDRSTSSINDELQYQVEPQEFTLLQGGGPQNDFMVQGIVTVAGKRWSNGRNFIRVRFSQKPKF